MRIRHALAATTAAIFLTASGLAQAQETTPSASDPGRVGTQSQRALPGGAGSPAEGNVASLPHNTLHEIKDDNARVQKLNVSSKDLAAMDIYGSDGKKIGEVNKVLADNSNAVKAVTVDVGGFLGMGSREVVIPIDNLQKGPEKNRLQVTMTKTEIEKLDKWENSERESAPPRNLSPSTAPSRTAPSTSPSR